MYWLIMGMVTGSAIAAPVATTPILAAFIATFGGLIATAAYWISPPSLAYPLGGEIGAIVVCGWVTLAYASKKTLPILAATAGVAAFLVMLAAQLPIFHARDYAMLAGPIQTREWTTDVQPKDPRKVRLVPRETALYLARKTMAQGGAIGSQFRIDEESLTLQKLDDGRLSYVVPLDYASFSSWTATDGVPGWIVVDAEDPDRQPELHRAETGRELRFTPGSWFDHDLDRQIRGSGYFDILGARRLYLDAGLPRWVIATTAPAHGWTGTVRTGTIVVDPTTGTVERYAPGEEPAWIEASIGDDTVAGWLTMSGSYADGWWNSVWGRRGLTEPDRPTLVWGSDGRAKWVTGLTSANDRDDSLVALVYTDARTGRSVRYATNGGATEAAVETAVNANGAISYKHLRATLPQIYNIAGTQTAVVPVVNAASAFAGVALVEIGNVQKIAYGATMSDALDQYKGILEGKRLEQSFQNDEGVTTAEGTIDHIGQRQGDATYLFHVEGTEHLFALTGTTRADIVVTRVGDRVKITARGRQAEVLPVERFENVSLGVPKQRLPPEATGTTKENVK